MQVGIITKLLNGCNVNTVCQEAKCPNQSKCFKQAKVTFLILGPFCTRNCRFCNVESGYAQDNFNYDTKEPERIVEAVKKLNLDFVVITSVTRDDLADGGSGAFQETICRLKAIDKKIRVEVLIPDFKGSILSLKNVIQAGPDVIAHNIETVARLYLEVRPLADYYLSLKVLKEIKEISPAVTTKSSILLGMGEREEEIISTMKDLWESNCDILTLGQYLAPSEKHYPVKEFISPGKFRQYKEVAMTLGFKAVISGPLVRSSYQAKEAFQECTM